MPDTLVDQHTRGRDGGFVPGRQVRGGTRSSQFRILLSGAWMGHHFIGVSYYVMSHCTSRLEYGATITQMLPSPWPGQFRVTGTRVYFYMCTSARRDMCIYTCLSTCARRYVCVHVCVETGLHACRSVCMHAQARAHVRTHSCGSEAAEPGREPHSGRRSPGRLPEGTSQTLNTDRAWGLGRSQPVVGAQPGWSRGSFSGYMGPFSHTENTF